MVREIGALEAGRGGLPDLFLFRSPIQADQKMGEALRKEFFEPQTDAAGAPGLGRGRKEDCMEKRGGVCVQMHQERKEQAGSGRGLGSAAGLSHTGP